MAKRPSSAAPASAPAAKKSKPASAASTPTAAAKPDSKKRKTTEDAPAPVAKKTRAAAPAAKTVVESVKEVVKPVVKKGKKVVADVAKAVESVTTAEPTPSASKPKSSGKPLKSALKPSSSSAPAPAPTRKTTKKPAASTYIAGFSSSSESDDDSDMDEDNEVISKGKKQIKGIERDLPVDVASLPTVAKDDEVVARKLRKAKAKNDKEKGVLYLGRIPHGFYEEEMKAYFSQFGDVTRLRLARNRKTGASKHFAYIEMSSLSVAEITAETMDNYLLMGHILKCSVVPQDQLHPDTWIGANKKFRPIPTARVERKKYEKTRTPEEKEKADKNLLKKQGKREEKIKSLGIDYVLPGHTE